MLILGALLVGGSGIWLWCYRQRWWAAFLRPSPQEKPPKRKGVQTLKKPLKRKESAQILPPQAQAANFAMTALHTARLAKSNGLQGVRIPTPSSQWASFALQILTAEGMQAQLRGKNIFVHW